MRTLRLCMLPVALTGGLSSAALAAEGSLSHSELQALLNQADQYGFSHYEEISVEDNTHLEIDGWRDDGWQLDLELLIEDGSVTHEWQRKSQIPDWSLTGDEVRQALTNAREAGMQRFEQLDVDERGHIEIEGYTTQNREVELRLNRDGLSVTGVEND
ncbi:hypothetical protein SAMN05661010_01473 [Modicisalibacter muralis]|uniref:Peptidase propeptide and YPEB domain-containing protein n=1 Tax=Modicisalibacter muralis TaxID=119000 RepID=A0A1G9JJB7_9GAMM|nr:PepSY domain-containing protein [Halomonas muralis]SDL37184.1 hypothetical protein SAMN05661010_01473 [Halomonas muralis]